MVEVVIARVDIDRRELDFRLVARGASAKSQGKVVVPADRRRGKRGRDDRQAHRGKAKGNTKAKARDKHKPKPKKHGRK